MSRKPREGSRTGYYHIMVRGINKESIFINNEDKIRIKELLIQKTKENEIEVIAYCIMPNHMHLVVRSKKEIMSETMKKINISYASYYNNKYQRVGHVFQDRFKSKNIETDSYLVGVIKYIHNNPIKSKIATTLMEYTWSSYKEFISKEEIISKIEKEFIMNYFNKSKTDFREFHMQNDNRQYLDIKEDVQRARENNAQNIIETFCVENGISDGAMIKQNIKYRDALIKILLNNSKLSHRKIAELIKVSRNIVHGIAKHETQKEPSPVRI